MSSSAEHLHQPKSEVLLQLKCQNKYVYFMPRDVWLHLLPIHKLLISAVQVFFIWQDKDHVLQSIAQRRTKPNSLNTYKCTVKNTEQQYFVNVTLAYARNTNVLALNLPCSFCLIIRMPILRKYIRRQWGGGLAGDHDE